MHTDTPHLQRRQDLRTGLGAGAGEIEAERDSSVPEEPEARGSRLRRLSPRLVSRA